MSAVSPLPRCSDVAKPQQYSAVGPVASRLSDYMEIVKPRISLMVMLTVSCGFVLAMESATVSMTLLYACIGIATVAVGSSAVNQWIERETDARMPRTMNRPLPSGRLTSFEVLTLGIFAAVFGCAFLAIFVNSLTAILTAVTFLLYAGVYTPMKRVTSICTVVGAIPGALPPVLGWVAAGGNLDSGALSLFATLFLWQFPHFFAIAWIYRDQYCNAGLRMLPAGKSLPHITGLLAVVYATCLIPISLLPAQNGMAGGIYSLVALLAGIAYLVTSVVFAWNETRTSARRLLLVSLVYLPVILLTLVWDHQRLLDRF